MNQQDRFDYTDDDFNYIRELIEDNSGINLHEGKKELVYGRLSKRLRLLGLNSFKEYCNLIKNGHESELVNCIDAITTNVTYFFRENHHFEYLRDIAIPNIIKDPKHQLKKKLRIWSAGCSTGEEPYSIEIVLRQFEELNSWDSKILATDLSSDVLNVAKEGIYRCSQVEKVDPRLLSQWFKRGKSNPDLVKLNDQLKSRIVFKRLNLNKEWKVKGPFDVIFCRNVIIYFDKETQKRLFDRFANVLADDGYLIIGHSESLFGVTERFKLIKRTIYNKIY